MFQSCVIAIIVPDVEIIKSWALENKIEGTFSVLCAHPEVKKLIHDDMLVWGKEAGLKSFEQVRTIIRIPVNCLINFYVLNTIIPPLDFQLGGSPINEISLFSVRIMTYNSAVNHRVF